MLHRAAFFAMMLAGLVIAAEPQPAPQDPIREAVVKELDALAARMQLPIPSRIICVGDSITAPPRQGQRAKYPELLHAALQKRFGEQVEVINAGVGGDTVVRALQRLETDVIAKKPTLVFINLGINDSKLAAPKHDKNVIPLETFINGYRSMIEAIKTKAKADVVAVGTIACVDEWTKKRAMDPNKPGNYFGKPEELKKYNAAVQALAKELQCDYVDLFDHFMAQPDLKALFNHPDGVHCNDRGHEQIALQLARYLAKKYPISTPETQPKGK